MATPLRALIVEDSDADAALLVRTLRQGGFDVSYQRVDSADGVTTCLDAETWDIVISDYSMPGFSGTAALALVRGKGLDTPFIFVSGTIGEEVAVEAMRVGAQDYIMKGNLTRLLPAIRRELQDAQVRQEHKHIDLKLRQLEKFEVIGQLAGGIAHDFNNVIGAIMGWADMGVREVSPDSRAARFFRQIHDQSNRAAGLTRQLLAYARRQILERRNIDLNLLIRESMTLVQTVTGERVEVKTSLAPNLWPARADSAQVEQVLMNLCVNARDAMPGGGRLLIETRNLELDEEYCKRHVYARPGRYVQLSVSDTGTGMDAATMDRIFEPFFTTKPKGKGTGLGLATTFGIIKQHEGSIEVVSEVGHGTTFHICVPAGEGAYESFHEVDNAPARGGDEVILVADDNQGVREMTQEVLESFGYRIILARDGEEALEKFVKYQDEIGLVLLDMVMPKLQGPEVYSRIRSKKAGVPVIFVSGYAEEDKLLDASLKEGAVMLQKPYGPKVLARKIRELLDRVK